MEFLNISNFQIKKFTEVQTNVLNKNPLVFIKCMKLIKKKK